MRLLSDTARKLYANQTVPTLKELLQLAMARNRSVTFDIKELMCRGHPYEDVYAQTVVDTIHRHKFPNDKVLALIFLV